MSRDININEIKPDPAQPRKHFNEKSITELAESMRSSGLAVSIMVRPTDGGYTIVHGERRFRAATKLEWKTIPAEVREMNDEDAYRIALIENLQRQDLSPIEEARTFEKYLDEGMTQTDLAKEVGKGQTYISHKMRLLELPDSVVTLLDVGQITEGHARLLMTLKTFFGDMTVTGPEDPEAFRKKDVPEIPTDPDEYYPLMLEMLYGFIDGISPLKFVLPPIPYIKDSDQVCDFMDACADHYRWAERHFDTGIPAYGNPMLWYAFQAVRSNMSVAKLADALRAYKRHVISMIRWHHLTSNLPERKLDKGNVFGLLELGAMADLLSSGIYGYAEKKNLPEHLAPVKKDYINESLAWPTLFNGLDDEWFPEFADLREDARKKAKEITNER